MSFFTQPSGMLPAMGMVAVLSFALGAAIAPKVKKEKYDIEASSTAPADMHSRILEAVTVAAGWMDVDNNRWYQVNLWFGEKDSLWGDRRY